ncbi:OTU domain-containing protein 6B [Halocaridina rubra]|uniref:OTU domain-containing protein 6B n=1 Tax=Halocaridina rubra TaxID=373956 RepID=A0AAN8XF73_HALRR
MEEEADVTNNEEEILARHRKEKKELQGKIQQLKKSINKDKKKKKDVTDEIASLEREMQERHDEELAELKRNEDKVNDLSNSVKSVNISEDGADDEAANEDAKSPFEASGTKQERKVSKAEKRRQKKAEANREREARIKEEKANNRYCARNVEAAKLKKLLQSRKLKMFEINPDGDCMYAAIAHQMGDDTTVQNLRTQASEFIRSHSDDFAPFMTDSKTGEMMTPEQFEEYCHLMETTPAWGGQPELRALSLAMKKKIEVLQAEGSPIVFGEECNEGKPIILTYYRHYYGLGEHYNSVAEQTGNEEEEEEEEEEET